MKKLMFGFAMAAAMVAVADIESSNVVGYANKDARAKNVVLIPTFYSVGTSGIDLNSIVPVGDEVDGEGGVDIQILDALNKTSASYFWLTEDGWGVEDGDGWYADDMETKIQDGDVTFAPGDGFLFQSPNAITVNFPAIAL